MINNPIATLK